jgi:hypothetical protein
MRCGWTLARLESSRQFRSSVWSYCGPYLVLMDRSALHALDPVLVKVAEEALDYVSG